MVASSIKISRIAFAWCIAATPTFVAFAVTGKTADSYNGLSHFRKDGFYNHLFCSGRIETFGDTISAAENLRYIAGVELHAMAHDLDSRIDSPNVLNHTIDLCPSNLGAEVMLPVEIALLDAVEVGDYEFADARTCKGDSNVGTQPPETSYPDNRTT